MGTGNILNGTKQVSLKKVTFEQRWDSGEGSSHASIWWKDLSRWSTVSAKTPRQEHALLLQEQESWNKVLSRNEVREVDVRRDLRCQLA